MLSVYGMSKRLPNLSLVQSHGEGFLGQGTQARAYSPDIERSLGEEQLEILARCYEDAKRLLTERRDALERLARRLLEQEKLDEHDIVEILGPHPGPGP
jgi:cell division protease FtsH